MLRSRRLVGLVAILGMLMAAGPASAAVGGSKIAVFHLNGPMIERPQGDMGFSLGFEPVTLKELVRRFEKAGEDDSIRAILLTVGQPGMGLAQVEEVQEAIREVGKPVYVHVDELNTGTYALVSSAKEISVTPTGDVWLLGFYSEAPYLRNLLDKIHVQPDFVHIGDFKSAGEMLYRTGPSEPAEKNMNWLLDGLYSGVVKMIADARFNGDEDKVRKLIDGGPYTAERAKEAGLIDRVEYAQEMTARLKDLYGEDLSFVRNYGKEGAPEVDFSNPFAFLKVFTDLMSGKEQPEKTSIAVVYVEGPIMTGQEQASPFGGGASEARSTTIRRALDDAAEDDMVKAVVLRVDSPGGSALASEIIYHATQRIRERGKPVVVSMGNVAASGGYYVSCGADSIIADPTTITASIGVVGGKLVTTGMWDSIGVNWHSYQRGDHAAIMTSARKWNEEERKLILDWMEEVYAVFKGHIVKHRGEKLSKPIDEMAGGRVFTGKQALELGLVDELGTMDDAIEKAADMASIADYDLRVLPRPKTIFDMLREGMGGKEEDSVHVAAGGNSGSFFGKGAPLMETVLPMIQSLDPQRARTLIQALTRLQLIHEEQVILMTPHDWCIRFR